MEENLAENAKHLANELIAEQGSPLAALIFACEMILVLRRSASLGMLRLSPEKPKP